MNKHKQMLEKAQCAVEKNRELVRQYAKKDNGIISCQNADG